MGAVVFRLRQVGAFVRLGRPLFLVGGVVLYALGAAIAVYQGLCIGGAINWSRYAWGLIAILATQLMTHYCNDYFDYAADQANTTPTRWSGGSRVLQLGELPRRVALMGALAFAAAAFGATAVLVAYAGAVPASAGLLVIMVALSWEYSAPPLRLHSTGWGELDVALVVACLTPVLAFYLQAGRLTALPLVAAAPLAALQVAMLLAIEFPDAAGDAATGKRTLVVRLGARRAARLYQDVLLGGYLALSLSVLAGLPWRVAAAGLSSAPLAGWQTARARRGAFSQPARWESLAFWSVALLIWLSVAELTAFVLSRP